MTLCECPLAGSCPRHKVNKPKRWHELCQTRDDYWQAWEEGRGPGQPAVQISRGFGDTVAKVIRRVFGIKPKGCGGCGRRQAWLNKLLPYK